jgi:hypothetical protein
VTTQQSCTKEQMPLLVLVVARKCNNVTKGHSELSRSDTELCYALKRVHCGTFNGIARLQLRFNVGRLGCDCRRVMRD